MKSIKLELDGTIASLHSSANGNLEPSSFVGTFQGIDIMKVGGSISYQYRTRE